jgi:drug/metabolite transporter (DMT)-like permease
VKAIFYNLLAWAILPFMDTIAKYLSSDLSFFQITWARYFFTVFFALPLMFFFFRKKLKWTTQPILQSLRGLLLFFANILFFYSISIISMAKALTLAFVAPLITTALSPFLLNENVGFKRWTAVIIGFVGSLVVIRPGFIDFNFAIMAGLGTGFFYGLYLIVTRKLHSSDNPLLTLLLTGVVGLFLGSLIVPFFWINPTSSQWLLLALMGIFACLGHFFLILSLKYADASKLAPLGYFEIVTNIILGYYFFADFPDKLSWLGLLIIIFSGIYISFRERKISN